MRFLLCCDPVRFQKRCILDGPVRVLRLPQSHNPARILKRFMEDDPARSSRLLKVIAPNYARSGACFVSSRQVESQASTTESDSRCLSRQSDLATELESSARSLVMEKAHLCLSVATPADDQDKTRHEAISCMRWPTPVISSFLGVAADA